MEQIVFEKKKVFTNKMNMEFESRSQNEALARMVVASFIMPLDPTVEEMSDVKTAVSEAVTNAIIHGYENTLGMVHMDCELKNNLLTVRIIDRGKGIDNLEQAMEPLYTSKPDKGRAGMGFVLMGVFMDDLKVQSSKENGTTVTMIKKIGRQWQEKGESGGNNCTD